MKEAKDFSESDFSVRDQFAGTDATQAASKTGAKLEGAPNGLPVTPVSEGRSSTPQIPLRRPVTPENMMKMIDWSHLVRGVWRRAWMIVLFVAIGVLLGLYGRGRMGKPKYDARASILYRADRQKQALSTPGTGVPINGLARATVTSLLRRAGNLEQVITNLNLNMTPEELGWRVQTKSDRNNEILLLHVEAMPTPELAVATANEVVKVGLEDNVNIYRKQALQLAEQFKEQFEAASTEATMAREALIAYQTQHQLLEVNAEAKAFLDSMGAVSERLRTAQIARDSQAVRIANYRRLIEELPAEVIRESFEDNPLKRSIANSEVALMEARTRYGPKNPRVLQMEDSIREMRQTMTGQTFDETRERVYVRNPAKQELEMEMLRFEAEQQVLNLAVTQIEKQAVELKDKYKHLPVRQLELAAFHQAQTAAEALVHDLGKSMADARRTAEIDLGDFEMLEPARTATASQGKLVVLLPILAVVFSTVAGLGLCLLLALVDPRLKAAGQIERLYSVPCLGTVPVSQDAAAVSAAFLPVCRTLYQRISGLPATDGARVFSVLSACLGDGKSVLAFQAARYWSALGIKTAYLDFDSSPNPWLHPVKDQAGIEDYLAGRAAWEDILFMQEDIACFKLKRDTGNLPERMHGKIMRRFMETLRAQYGCVILEVPAWLAEETSARMLAQMTDLSVWIAATTLSTRPVLNQACESLDRAEIRPIGIILNRVSKLDERGKRRGPM